MWLCNKRFGGINIINAALCWSIWKLRISLCFHGVSCKHAHAVAVGAANAALLEDFGAFNLKIVLGFEAALSDGAQRWTGGGINGAHNISFDHFYTIFVFFTCYWLV
jgi:hypothetical protein